MGLLGSVSFEQITDGAKPEDLLNPFYPRFWEDRLWQPARQPEGRKKSLGIFTCDMSDLFGIGIPQEWQNKVFKVIRTCAQHRFYLLTKQPQNLAKFSPFPDNCWVGVTVTSNAAMTMAYYGLRDIKAGKKFISFEPLLGSIGMNDHVSFKDGWVDWVIIGSQTKPYKPPQKEWVREIVEAADKAGVKVFLKDNLNPIFADNECKYFTEYRDKLFAFRDFEPNGITRWHLRQETPE